MNGNLLIGGSLVCGVSEIGSVMFDESEQVCFVICVKGKRGLISVVGICRKVDDGFVVKGLVNKKVKINGGFLFLQQLDYDDYFDDEDYYINKDGIKIKMIDEEKRKNFFECNRYVFGFCFGFVCYGNINSVIQGCCI